MKVKPYFRWYDLWMGGFWARKEKTLYFGYFPMLGIKFDFSKPSIQKQELFKSRNADHGEGKQ